VVAATIDCVGKLSGRVLIVLALFEKQGALLFKIANHPLGIGDGWRRWRFRCGCTLLADLG
jgi:hypothetical protein